MPEPAELRQTLNAVRVFSRAGVLAPLGPRTAARTAGEIRRWGRGLAGAAATNAARYGGRISLIDELGPVTHEELHERSGRLAVALGEEGVRAGGSVALLCRDSRFFVEAAIATAKTGADLLLLNTAFSGPQLHDVLEREAPRAVIHDAEFASLLDGAPGDLLRVTAWQDEPDGVSIDSMAASASRSQPPPPDSPGRTILLTSGTTGTPKGARRSPDTPTAAIVSVLERIPLRHRDRHFVAAPMFHAWGFAHFGLGLLLGCEIVMRRRFDAERTLAAIARTRATSAALVPVMAQRILALGSEVLDRYDTSSLQLVALGGSAIPGDLATRWMDSFGDCAYNAYGSSEVAIVSIATPEDLRADPATAGRPVSSVQVKLIGADDEEVAAGDPGRIFVASGAAFEGYSGGETRASLDDMIATGDMGVFDAAGRLSIVGRDDDMIVSGGENVYPQEVEDVISGLPDVAEVGVVGVDDEEFGQRLHAFVVPAGGARLDADEIKSAVRAQLARYKVPREVTFREELPRTATGKLLRRELA